MSGLNRRRLAVTDMNPALARVSKAVLHRLEKHGPGAFAGRHEVLGIITQEYTELVEAVRDDTYPNRFISELEDIAVACIIGMASLTESDTEG